MPTSHHHQISTIMDAVIKLRPKTILDVGVGFGKYGVLCREYLELWDGREDYHRFLRRIDGIEAFERYLTPLHTYIYDQVHVGQVQEVIHTLAVSYDLVLMIDVLEHVSDAHGRALIEHVLKHHRGMLISTPKDVGDQGHAFDNENEAHVSQWTPQLLKTFGPAVVLPDRESHIVYLGTSDSVLALRSPRWKRVRRWGSIVPFARPLYRALRRRALRP